MHACHSTLFLFLLDSLFLFFLNPYSCNVVVMVMLWFSPSGCYCYNDDTMHNESPLYIACRDCFLPFYPLTTFFWIWVSFSTTYWFVNYLATTTYLCWPCHSPLPDKENCFVCLFTMAFLSSIVWVFSLAIPYGMHLVIPTHHSLFWVICHPSRTFPPKRVWVGTPK